MMSKIEEQIPAQKVCWCKDCKHSELSYYEEYPYCICNNNESSDWHEPMDLYSSCKHCEPKEG